MRLKALASTIATVIALTSLTSCGSDSTSTTTPSPTASSGPPATSVPPSPSNVETTTTEGAPPLPEAAKSRDAQGAAAFVKYWWSIVNYSQASGDTQVLNQISDATCQGCDGGIATIQRVWRDQGEIEGGVYSASATGVALQMSNNPIQFTVPTRVRSTKQITKYPDKTRTEAPKNEVYDMVVEWRSGGWLMLIFDR